MLYIHHNKFYLVDGFVASEQILPNCPQNRSSRDPFHNRILCLQTAHKYSSVSENWSLVPSSEQLAILLIPLFSSPERERERDVTMETMWEEGVTCVGDGDTLIAEGIYWLKDSHCEGAESQQTCCHNANFRYRMSGAPFVGACDRSMNATL